MSLASYQLLHRAGLHVYGSNVDKAGLVTVFPTSRNPCDQGTRLLLPFDRSGRPLTAFANPSGMLSEHSGHLPKVTALFHLLVASDRRICPHNTTLKIRHRD
jgi:hypothetical protein